MTIDERTMKCPICGEPYKVYAFSAADQSACPQCVRKAAAKEDKGMRPYTDHPGYTATPTEPKPQVRFATNSALAALDKVGRGGGF